MMDERAVTGGVKDMVIAGNRLTVRQSGKGPGKMAVALVLAQVAAVMPCTNWRMGISTLKPGIHVHFDAIPAFMVDRSIGSTNAELEQQAEYGDEY